ncbi:aminotransferase class V-fold PLP-dependent enzyme [Suipraeoptans intestinalis]|uniref:Aminotransferase class V-fold PLP-dependent enzyme n=1 Tax=Suipraeoptans intestinalis TaxID=2606628 RepID=A0A6N7V1H7_9FIRM|nr:aminotransferase class V-fold PLP-dependent enzyme [Suipraeoptans intestinalis]MDD7770012.1 aminotransferase class V-fold PLP-dependent enzyme [Suipraeoptans intestinalis]MDY3121742.1 aminotransferase class V-fold PLP-dependent enzyme [Suipraeoptans intestinalis]MSR93706.1 aminotransferase class V-fold PLP-dependent enzyme [Suipraeoptans intestinalis]
MNEKHGKLFSDEYQAHLKEKFFHADADPEHGNRLFFENSGGSLRLKKAVERKAEAEAFPDCPERVRGRGFELSSYITCGTQDILETVFGAKDGALITELSASQTMFHAVGTILEGIDWGTNAVTSALEHPSAHDAVEYYCARTHREFRVVPANRITGGLDVDTILSHVDENTCLLSIMAASNISGNVMDIKEISRRAREINPDIYIVSDAVQHAPHAPIDVADWKVDVANIAPYKFFGVRGCGFAYVSDRVASLPHRKLIHKPANVWALGTPTPGNFAAMTAVIDYVCDIGSDSFLSENTSVPTDRRTLFVKGMHRIHMQERALLYRMLEGTEKTPGLRHIPNVEVYVDTEDLTAKDLIIAMGIKGLDYSLCSQLYLEHGVTIFERLKSSPYSQRIIETLGLEGALRVSPLHCHGRSDIDRFLEITSTIASSVSLS